MKQIPILFRQAYSFELAERIYQVIVDSKQGRITVYDDNDVLYQTPWPNYQASIDAHEAMDILTTALYKKA